MAGRTVTIELPDDPYDRLHRRAREARRTLAAEVVHLLSGSAAPDDALSSELEQELVSMSAFDDDQVRRAAATRLTARQMCRLEALHFAAQGEGLTAAERKEEQALLRAYERAMLIRAQALAALRQRGHDIADLYADAVH